MSELNNLALTIQTDLNTIAKDAYDNQDITEKVVFLVTDNEQKFDAYFTQMEYVVGEDIAYTPILLKRTLATKQDDYTYGKFIESYRLEIMSYEKDKTALEWIFNAYTSQENINDYEVIGGVQVKKNHSKLLFQQLVNANSGKDEHFIYFVYDMTWSYVIGSVVKESSSIAIDGVTIDFIGIAYQNDKVQIANRDFGTNNDLPQTNGQTIALTLPIVKSGTQAEKNKELFDDITIPRYNKTHTLSWTIDGYKTVTMEGVVRSGTVNYNNDELINFVIVFERALPRTIFKVDNVSLPILSLNFQREYNIESIVTAEEVENEVVSSGVSIIARIAHTDTAKSEQLIEDILKNNLYNDYEVYIRVGNVEETYPCKIRNGSYAYEQTGELIYEVTFVKGV